MTIPAFDSAVSTALRATWLIKYHIGYGSFPVGQEPAAIAGAAHRSEQPSPKGGFRPIPTRNASSCCLEPR